MPDVTRDLLDSIPVEQLAAKVGASTDDVRSAIAAAAPALLRGMEENAKSSPERAVSLLKALAEDHDPRLLDADDPVTRVDDTEGAKIVDHVFGPRTNDVAQRLGATGSEPSLIQRILPMIAPLVMSWLAGRLGGGTDRTPASGGGGGLGDLLGGVLGGAGGGLGDLLGGVLGGDDDGDGGFDLGGILGQLGGLASESAGSGLPDLSDLLGGGR